MESNEAPGTAGNGSGAYAAHREPHHDEMVVDMTIASGDRDHKLNITGGTADAVVEIVRIFLESITGKGADLEKLEASLAGVQGNTQRLRTAQVDKG